MKKVQPQFHTALYRIILAALKAKKSGSAEFSALKSYSAIKEQLARNYYNSGNIEASLKILENNPVIKVSGVYE